MGRQPSLQSWQVKQCQVESVRRDLNAFRRGDAAAFEELFFSLLVIMNLSPSAFAIFKDYGLASWLQSLDLAAREKIILTLLRNLPSSEVVVFRDAEIQDVALWLHAKLPRPTVNCIATTLAVATRSIINSKCINDRVPNVGSLSKSERDFLEGRLLEICSWCGKVWPGMRPRQEPTNGAGVRQFTHIVYPALCNLSA